MELVVRRSITQEADEYKNRSANAEVAKALQEAGIELCPGESVEYVLVRGPSKAIATALYSLDDGYDIDKYLEMALKAIETLLSPFGYDVEKLKGVLGLEKPKRKKAGSVQMEMF